MPIPAAERSKANVCGRSLAGIAGSNPAGGAWEFVVFVFTVTMKGRSQDDQDKEVRIKYRQNREKTCLGAWMSVVSVECCQVEVCHEPIPRPEESYRLWCVTYV